jgi:hypothetical protein
MLHMTTVNLSIWEFGILKVRVNLWSQCCIRNWLTHSLHWSLPLGSCESLVQSIYHSSPTELSVYYYVYNRWVPLNPEVDKSRFIPKNLSKSEAFVLLLWWGVVSLLNNPKFLWPSMCHSACIVRMCHAEVERNPRKSSSHLPYVSVFRHIWKAKGSYVLVCHVHLSAWNSVTPTRRTSV